jgi:hypothetical protein
VCVDSDLVSSSEAGDLFVFRLKRLLTDCRVDNVGLLGKFSTAPTGGGMLSKELSRATGKISSLHLMPSLSFLTEYMPTSPSSHRRYVQNVKNVIQSAELPVASQRRYHLKLTSISELDQQFITSLHPEL